MSRSYKKYPIYTDGRPSEVKKAKRLANKRIRRYHKKIECGNAYKKISCSYEIHDYKRTWTWNEAKEEYNRHYEYWKKFYPNLEDFYRFWRRYHRNK